MRLRAEALVEHGAYDVRVAVEPEGALPHRRRAQPEVARDLVERGAGSGVAHDEVGVDERRALGRPEQASALLAVGQGRHDDVDGGDPCRQPHADLREHLVAEAQRDLQRDRGGRRAGQRHLGADPSRGQVGGPGHVGQVEALHRLAPDRLPDAGRAVVPDVVRVLAPVLLAARHVERLCRVLGSHDDDVPARVARPAGQRLGDVGGEGRLPACVAGDEPPVAPDVGAVVHGPEVHERPGGRRGQVEGVGRQGAAVPHHRVEAGLADAGRRGLGRERHLDRAVVRRRGGRVRPALGTSDVAVVVGEPPRAVQRGPALAAQLRPRVGAVLPGNAHCVPPGAPGCDLGATWVRDGV